MDEKHQLQLDRDIIETIRSAAKKLTGFKRREFLAEIPLQYCDGKPRVTEQKFGFSRAAAEKVREKLLQVDLVRQDVPCRQTVGTLLNRLGYRLRSVLKTKPQKK